MITTPEPLADLIYELIDDGYELVRTTRFQNNPIERRFLQYLQMSGGRFVVRLREVFNSERILSCRSLIKENYNFWEENIDSDAEESLDSINDLFDERADEIMEAVLDDNEKFLQWYQAMLPESSSNEAPVTYVSKPWHHKKLTLKTALISNCDHVVDCLYHQDS